MGGEIEMRREWLPWGTVEGDKVFLCLVRSTYQQGINMDRETSLGVQRIRWECCCFPIHLCPGCFLGSWVGPPPSRAPSAQDGEMEGARSIEADREAHSRSPGLVSNVVVFPPTHRAYWGPGPCPQHSEASLCSVDPRDSGGRRGNGSAEVNWEGTMKVGWLGVVS